MSEETQRYTRAEVSQRDGKTDKQIWFIYKDGVYDVTTYVNEHPGGDVEILAEAGKDATSPIKSAGHTKDAFDLLAKYKIGEIVEEEKWYDANGKKLKSASDGRSGRSWLNVCTCGLLG